MSTIASPRPSLTLSSRRASTSTDTTNTTNTTSHRPTPSTSTPTGSLRRNRAALRDYYHLQTTTTTPSAPSSDLTTPHPSSALSPTNELDTPHFSPSTHAQTLLQTLPLSTLLQTEASLVSEIRTLDGEKKALVYDNYSKLITATDTIRVMREKMDPMMPSTSSLGEDVGRVVELSVGLSERGKGKGKGGVVVEGEGVKRRRGERETVRWVLGAGRRLRGLVREGRKEEAEGEWREVKELLDGWGDVQGVEEVRRECEAAMEGEET